MKVFVRKELCLDRPINLRRLSPTMKIYAGIATSWKQTKFAQRMEHRRQERQHAEQVKMDDGLKDSILVKLYSELTQNRTLGDTDICEAVILSIDYKYKESLERILNNKDFILYNIERVTEDSNMRAAFKDLPILIKVSKKLIEV